MDLDDTIVALSSARGGGGRAVVRLSGPQALAAVHRLLETPAEGAGRGWQAVTLRLPDLTAPLPADRYYWPAPRTYTGQEVVELHTLASPPLVELLVSALLRGGARAAQPGEFTLRAFLAGKLDLPQAEAVRGVIEARGDAELQQALAQLAGGVTRPLHGLRDDLLNLLADLEAGLDFAEENISFVGRDELLHRLGRGLAQVTLLQKQLAQRAVSGRPFRVVLAGPPNAGKSSLFNALTGAGALVSPEPGTTRDYLARIIHLDGIPVELIDTAGWQPATDSIAGQAQALADAQTQQADLVLLCAAPGQEARRGSPDWVLVATMCDLGEPVGVLLADDVAAAERLPAELRTSAVTGQGLDDLRALLAARARTQVQPPLAPSVSRCRHHVDACLERLRRAHELVLFDEPPELLALELRGALEDLGALTGAVYTEDLLDRIFSRFCIGK